MNANKKKEIVFPYVLNPKKREIAKKYMKIKLFNSVVNGLIVPVLFLVYLIFSGLNTVLASFSEDIFSGMFYVQVYAFIFTTILSFIEFPLTFYSGFILEHKFKLSNYTLKGWFKDYFKSLFLGYVFTTIIVSALYFLLGTSQNWWVYLILFLVLFELFDNFIYPVIIFPFFYKVEAYKDSEMKQKLLNMVKNAGVKGVKEVVVAKESEKSKKANAMFTGFGPTKKIVLFDTLLKNFTKDEIETVIAHELGHYVNKDVWKGILFGAIETTILVYITKVVLESSVGMFGVSSIDDLAGFPLIYLVFIIVGFVLSPVFLFFSRKMESKADLFALEHSKKPLAQISTEKRLTDMNLIDYKPSKWVELLFFSHPPAWKRVKMAEEWWKQSVVSKKNKNESF